MLLRHFLLVLLFLLSQAGALAHGIGHHSDYAHHDHDGPEHEPVCELCLAFAPLGAGMAGVPPAWSPPEPAPFVDAAVPASQLSAFQPTYLSRGPPRLSW